jgi:hypothetical protein
MIYFHALIGFLVPLASARTLENAGSGNPAIQRMWIAICSILTCSLPSGDSLLVALVNALVSFLFPLISVVATCLIIYAGITIVISNGSEDKIGEAKKIIMYACVGVVLALMTDAILRFAASYLSVILS